MRKYLQAFKSSFLSQIKEKGQIIGRLLVYIVNIYLFYQVFESVKADDSRLWYYVMTEGIILSSTTSLVLQITNDFHTNHVVYFLLRPVNYCFFRFSENMGASIIRYAVLMLCGVVFAGLLQGSIFNKISSLSLSFFVGILGMILLAHIFIGLISFWVKEIKTLLYFNLTACFCFGGLIIPITYYPPLIQTICFCTPYPWILWWPGSFFSGAHINHKIAFLGWAFWSLFFGLINLYIYNRYKKNLVMDGG